jgi:uncharacterized protein YjbI with pentapeptide repeats
MRKNLTLQNAAWVALAVTVAAGILGGYWYDKQREVANLQTQIGRLPNGKDKVSLVKDRIALENAIAGSLVQTAGGLLLFVTAYVSLQTLKATQRNVLVAEEKQVTERFTQAINQLGNEGNITIRLGGIYALERIARDSEKDHWPIMEVLTSFIQEKSVQLDIRQTKKLLSTNTEQVENSPLPKITKDVQAALTVIGRRDTKRDPEGKYLDLSKAYLVQAVLIGADLTKADLSHANLIKANLTQAILPQAVLIGADLTAACLAGADLCEARLVQADLSHANLRKATLRQANLTRAILTEADLTAADLSGADLTAADLSEADLSEADLSEVQFGRAKLNETILDETKLEGAKHLTPQQIKTAFDWEDAHYDEDCRQKLGLPPAKEV